MTKKKLAVDDVAVAKPKRKQTAKPLMKAANTTNERHTLDPIPPEAADNPVGWATDHLETLIPQSAKEYEYALKFGDNKTRLDIAGKIMAMKGLSDKGPQVGNAVPAIQLIFSGGGNNGASNPPLLPFQSVEQKKLPETVEGTIIPQEKMK